MAGEQEEILGSAEETDANDNSGWDVEGNDPAGLGEDPSTSPQDLTPEGEEGNQPSAAEPLKTEQGKEPAKPKGEEELPFHDHPRWQEVQTELKDLREAQATLEADRVNLSKQLEFYAEQYNQTIGNTTDPQTAQPGQPVPGINPASPQVGQQTAQPNQPAGVQPEVPGQLPPEIVGPATQEDAEGNPVGGWENQQQIAQYMEHRAGEVAQRGMETAYTERIAPVFDRFNQAITSMQDMLLSLNFPKNEEDPNSGWEPAYKKALEDVFVSDDAGKVLAVKNQATLNYWQSQPFPKLAAIEHGMRKLAPTMIKEGKQKAINTTLKGLKTKPAGPTTPDTSSGSQPNDIDIGWDVMPGSKQSETYLDKKGLI